ncbi:MAG: hypothetical protein IBJ00_03480 [Alphaproteobacteria bacterium]|nr:hypothetical protein [Alphaproteobacteria bacterium]
MYQKSYVDTSQELQAVKIDTIANRDGQQLRNFLIDTFTISGESVPKKYRLIITLKETKHQIGFRRDLTPRHTKITIDASFHLLDIHRGKTLLTDKVRAVASYSLGAQSSFGALSAETSEKSARSNALKALSNDIKLRVAAFLTTHNKPSAITERHNED